MWWFVVTNVVLELSHIVICMLWCNVQNKLTHACKYIYDVCCFNQSPPYKTSGVGSHAPPPKRIIWMNYMLWFLFTFMSTYILPADTMSRYTIWVEKRSIYYSFWKISMCHSRAYGLVDMQCTILGPDCLLVSWLLEFLIVS